MKIAILGYGAEGQSAAAYFQKAHHETKIFDHFEGQDLESFHLADYDLVMRSPSVRPQGNWSSVTKYFFAKCPCPIIGVTGTKGKGTTCSFITSILEHLGHKVWLVGNIGTPALDVLDQVKPEDVVVYELSSFQLWDLDFSPHIALVLRIEPDHLNVHKDFDDYVAAKSNITRHQTSYDYCIYYRDNAESKKIAQLSPGQKYCYPKTKDREIIDQVLNSLTVPGQHNREDAEAALLAIAAYYRQNPCQFIQEHLSTIQQALHDFKGLPHRLQFLREVNQVAHYDDNFSASFPALDVALAAFPEQDIILIAGGKDRGIDPAPAKNRIFQTANVRKVFLIGETSSILAKGEDPTKYQICDSLDGAFASARKLANELAQNPKHNLPVVLLMSPGAPSFDMFKNFSDRGEQFQKLVQEL